MTDPSFPDDGSLTRILAVSEPHGEPAATVKLAADLAAGFGAALSALAVDHPAIRQLAKVAGLSQDAVAAEIRRTRLDALEALAAETAAAARPDCAVRLGKPFLEIVQHVLAGRHDLVVKTAEPLNGLHRHLLASTDQHLLRKCPAPVWLRRRGTSGRPTRVLAAVDVDPFDAAEPETAAALNRRIALLAGRIATWADADLHLLNVWDAPAEWLVRSFSDDGAGTTYAAQVEDHHWHGLLTVLEELRPALARLEGDRAAAAHPHLARGSARRQIPATVQSLGADLLVLGTVARTGVPGLLIGNTAEDVLNSVGVSVVAVKPPGYATPLGPA